MRANQFCARRSSSPGSAASAAGGFTLLELLVALTLAAVISLCISTVGTQAQRIYHTTTTKVEVYQKFRYALNDMETALRGWEPTTSLEYFIDKPQSTQGGFKNGHWDDGEELGIHGPNLDGGQAGEYDEGAKIFERQYTLRSGPNVTRHDAFSIYFRGPVTVDGVVKLANIEYMLADPREIEDDRISAIPEEVEDNASFILLKTVRYLDINGENYDRSSTDVAQKFIEICPNVTDLRIEYFYDNIFDQKPGAFVAPSTERALVDSEKPPTEIDTDVWMKEFLYGGFRDFSKGVAYAGRRDVQNGVDDRPFFQAQGGANVNRFSQLGVGQSLSIWSEGSSKFPPGDKTISRNDNGRLFFQEQIDSSNWEGNQTGLRFRAAYVPSAIRISIRVLNDEGREPRTLTVTVHPYRATL